MRVKKRLAKVEGIPKRHIATVFTEALFTIPKAWKQPRCPLTDEWVNMWYIYTVEYYSAIKRNGTQSE